MLGDIALIKRPSWPPSVANRMKRKKLEANRRSSILSVSRAGSSSKYSTFLRFLRLGQARPHSTLRVATYISLSLLFASIHFFSSPLLPFTLSLYFFSLHTRAIQISFVYIVDTIPLELCHGCTGCSESKNRADWLSIGTIFGREYNLFDKKQISLKIRFTRGMGASSACLTSARVRTCAKEAIWRSWKLFNARQ